MELGDLNTGMIAPEVNTTKEVIHPRELKVGVIGYGNYGNALATRLAASGVDFVIGTRDVERAIDRANGLEERRDLMTYKSAVENSDVVILAIPFKAYDKVVQPLSGLLENKIVIDVSNAEKKAEPCHAEYLCELVPSAHVVKAFNTISAWSLENDLYGASRNTFVCSNDVTSRRIVMQLAQDMGLTPVERGKLRAAELLEKKPLQLFPEWRCAFWVTLAMLVVITGYLYLRVLVNVDPSKVGTYAVMVLANAVTGCMVLGLLSAVFLPGCIAGVIQLTRGTKYSVFPNWLDVWMKARKQLGLFALMFAGFHACLSITCLAGQYYKGMSNVLQIPGTTLSLYQRFKMNAELSLLYATISLTLLAIQGLTSLPSVNQSMSWKEWDFIQSKCGYAALLFGILHVVSYAKGVFDPVKMKRWKYGIPHQIFLLVLLSSFVLLLKLFLVLPGVGSRLQRIRGGWETGENNRVTLIAESNCQTGGGGKLP